MSDEHTFVDPESFRCSACGETSSLKLPTTLYVFMKRAEAFETLHLWCVPLPAATSGDPAR